MDPDRLPEWAGAVFDFQAAHPRVARLRLHEALSYGDGAVPNEGPRQASNTAMVHAVEEGQRRGSVDAGLDARDTVMLIVALASWHASVPQLARMVEGEGKPGDARLHARRRAAVVEAVRRLDEPRRD